MCDVLGMKDELKEDELKCIPCLGKAGKSNDDIQNKSKVSLLSPSLGLLGLWGQKPCRSFCFGEVWFQLVVSRPCLHRPTSPCSELEAAHHHRQLPSAQCSEYWTPGFSLLDVINITSPAITHRGGKAAAHGRITRSLGHIFAPQ